MTDFITLTDMWNQGEFLRVGETINDEKWCASRVAEFCAYFFRYNGQNQLDILYKFL